MPVEAGPGKGVYRVRRVRHAPQVDAVRLLGFMQEAYFSAGLYVLPGNISRIVDARLSRVDAQNPQER